MVKSHQCDKEEEISAIKLDVALIKEHNIYQNKKIDEIHKALVGNGKPGLINEFNQYKGASKFATWVISIILSILTIAIAVVATTK